MSRWERYPRLYVNRVESGGLYCMANIDLLPAIWDKCLLSGLEMLLFTKIAFTYDSHVDQGERTPCGYSYGELATKHKASKSGVKQALDNLIECKLIVKVGGERKGRAKTIYVPNVEYLHQLLDEYLGVL